MTTAHTWEFLAAALPVGVGIFWAYTAALHWIIDRFRKAL